MNDDNDEQTNDEIVEGWFAEASSPREVSADSRDRWVSAIFEAAWEPPLPDELTVRVVGAMTRTSSNRRRSWRLTAVAAVLLGVLLAWPGGGGSSLGPDSAIDGSGFRLIAFDSCDAFLGQMKHEALRRGRQEKKDLGDDELHVGSGVVGRALRATPASGDAASPAPTVAPMGEESGASSASTFSPTNVQDRAVDEADQVKALGDRLFDVRGYVDTYLEDGGRELRPPRVRELKVSESGVKVVSELALGWGEELMVVGDRLWVFGTDGERARADLLDTSGAEMKVAWEYEVDGEYRGARTLGGTLQMVVVGSAARGGLDLTEVYDQKGYSSWERRVRRSDAEDWLPHATTRTYDASERTTSVLHSLGVGCENLLRPDSATVDFDTTLVLALPPGGRGKVTTAGVLGLGQVVYASPTSVYVAGRGRSAQGVDSASPVHRFAIEDGGPRYVSSGRVEGQIYGPLAMSESDGILRVASTVRTPFVGAGSQPRDPTVRAPSPPSDRTDNLVTTLRESGHRLEVVGTLAGLGKPNESITAARFDGARAYISTAPDAEPRDPFYVIDLSDPSKPKVVGTLDLPGSTLYLHRISPTRLVAVSRNVLPPTTEASGQPAVRVSLIDVSDESAPRAVDAIDVPGETLTDVDHHQYLYLDDSSTLLVGGREAHAFEIGASQVRTRWTLAHAGRPFEHGIIHEKWTPPVERLVVKGSLVVSLSDAGAMVSDLATGHELGFAAFWP